MEKKGFSLEEVEIVELPKREALGAFSNFLNVRNILRFNKLF